MTSIPPAPTGLPPTLRHGWSVHALDGGALLGFQARRKLLWLNGTAAWLFLRLAAGDSRAHCSQRLAELCGLGQAKALRAVGETLADLERALATREERFDLALEVPETDVPRSRKRARPAPAHGDYAIGGRRVRIACASDDDQRQVASVLAPLAVTGARSGAVPDHVIDVGGGDNRVGGDDWILLDRAEGLRRAGASQLLPQLAKVLFVAWYRARADFIAVHAGLAAVRGRGILLPGAGGAGKTTAVAALLTLGARYHGDDFTALAPSGHACAFPFPLTVKQPNLPVLQVLFPELANAALHTRADGQKVAFLVPEQGADSGVPADCIVFPRFCRGGQTAIERVPPGAALRRLALEWSVVGRPNAERLNAFVGWLDRVPAFEVTYPDPASAAAALSRVLSDVF